MLKFIKKGFLVVLSSLLLTACPDKELNDLTGDQRDINEFETIELKVSCDQSQIQEYIKEGWIVKTKESKEVPCSWKTVKATDDCKLDTDKGCKITVPDVYGEEIKYILERKLK